MRPLPEYPVLALSCVLAASLALSRPASGQWTATAAATQLAFTVQAVDAPWSFGSMGDRSMRLDRAGRPHCAGGTVRLWYGYHDGTAWHVETVDEAPGAASYVALALDNNDNPWISYSCGGDHEGGGKLKVAHRVGGSWHIDTVDAGPGLWVWSTSIACDRSGRPHVSYYNEAWASGGVLKYARWDGASWSVTTVVGAGISWDYYPVVEYIYYLHPGGTSIALDPAGRPCIAFYVFQWLALGFASWNGSSWEFEYADGAHNGQFCSLAFDPAGAPAISYFDAQNSLLK